MTNDRLAQDLKCIVKEWTDARILRENDIFVVGCSTSEVAGQPIGTAGSEEIASTIYQQLQSLQNATGINLAFQCCEHLNRAIVVERTIATTYSLPEVTAIPVREAGGAMAAYAYQHMNDPIVVEKITAEAGMDIGETMIGMHLKHVAVPLKFKQRFINYARVRAARTRPKLVGGSRAYYGK
ncbi:TIGR01440 family protein [Oceanobacillus iheyensis]|uniref:TIGR01440 family protein n=1 Tax=Oceanobacillus iheyensis TaxID=182710 RepID=UPI003635FD6D